MDMVCIYKITFDFNMFQSVYFQHDFIKLNFNTDSREIEWGEPETFIVDEGKRKGDFYAVNNTFFIIRPHLDDLLCTFLEMAGEVLPMTIDNELCYASNIREYLNCLN